MQRFLDVFIAVLTWPFRPRTKRVLTLLNGARHALRLPPLSHLPSGEAGRTTTCPIARALPALVGADGVGFEKAEWAERVATAWNVPVTCRQGIYVVPLPTPLRRFVQHVDAGAYPLLTRRASL